MFHKPKLVRRRNDKNIVQLDSRDVVQGIMKITQIRSPRQVAEANTDINDFSEKLLEFDKLEDNIEEEKDACKPIMSPQMKVSNRYTSNDLLQMDNKNLIAKQESKPERESTTETKLAEGPPLEDTFCSRSLSDVKSESPESSKDLIVLNVQKESPQVPLLDLGQENNAIKDETVLVNSYTVKSYPATKGRSPFDDPLINRTGTSTKNAPSVSGKHTPVVASRRPSPKQSGKKELENRPQKLDRSSQKLASIDRQGDRSRNCIPVCFWRLKTGARAKSKTQLTQVNLPPPQPWINTHEDDDQEDDYGISKRYLEMQNSPFHNQYDTERNTTTQMQQDNKPNQKKVPNINFSQGAYSSLLASTQQSGPSHRLKMPLKIQTNNPSQKHQYDRREQTSTVITQDSKFGRTNYSTTQGFDVKTTDRLNNRSYNASRLNDTRDGSSGDDFHKDVAIREFPDIIYSNISHAEHHQFTGRNHVGALNGNFESVDKYTMRSHPKNSGQIIMSNGPMTPPAQNENQLRAGLFIESKLYKRGNDQLTCKANEFGLQLQDENASSMPPQTPYNLIMQQQQQQNKYEFLSKSYDIDSMSDPMFSSPSPSHQGNQYLQSRLLQHANRNVTQKGIVKLGQSSNNFKPGDQVRRNHTPNVSKHNQQQIPTNPQVLRQHGQSQHDFCQQVLQNAKKQQKERENNHIDKQKMLEQKQEKHCRSYQPQQKQEFAMKDLNDDLKPKQFVARDTPFRINNVSPSLHTQYQIRKTHIALYDVTHARKRELEFKDKLFWERARQGKAAGAENESTSMIKNKKLKSLQNKFKQICKPPSYFVCLDDFTEQNIDYYTKTKIGYQNHVAKNNMKTQLVMNSCLETINRKKSQSVIEIAATDAAAEKRKATEKMMENFKQQKQEAAQAKDTEPVPGETSGHQAQFEIESEVEIERYEYGGDGDAVITLLARTPHYEKVLKTEKATDLARAKVCVHLPDGIRKKTKQKKGPSVPPVLIKQAADKKDRHQLASKIQQEIINLKKLSQEKKESLKSCENMSNYIVNCFNDVSPTDAMSPFNEAALKLQERKRSLRKTWQLEELQTQLRQSLSESHKQNQQNYEMQQFTKGQERQDHEHSLQIKKLDSIKKLDLNLGTLMRENTLQLKIIKRNLQYILDVLAAHELDDHIRFASERRKAREMLKNYQSKLALEYRKLLKTFEEEEDDAFGEVGQKEEAVKKPKAPAIRRQNLHLQKEIEEGEHQDEIKQQKLGLLPKRLKNQMKMMSMIKKNSKLAAIPKSPRSTLSDQDSKSQRQRSQRQIGSSQPCSPGGLFNGGAKGGSSKIDITPVFLGRFQSSTPSMNIFQRDKGLTKSRSKPKEDTFCSTLNLIKAIDKDPDDPDSLESQFKVIKSLISERYIYRYRLQKLRKEIKEHMEKRYQGKGRRMSGISPGRESDQPPHHPHEPHAKKCSANEDLQEALPPEYPLDMNSPQYLETEPTKSILKKKEEIVGVDALLIDDVDIDKLTLKELLTLKTEFEKEEEHAKKASLLDKKLEQMGGEMSMNSSKVNVKALMKDSMLVDRYNDYILQCLFNYADPFLKARHRKYMIEIQGWDPTSFFDRMVKDQKRRDRERAGD